MKSRPDKVESRNEAFAEKTVSRIWHERPSPKNPYIANECHCHGYDLTELIRKRSFCDVFYLLFRGELPEAAQSQLLETLMIALVNPGPRHPATRAAMNAGVSKADPAHILPIGLMILGGEHLGAGEVEPAMRFLRKNLKTDPTATARALIDASSVASSPDDVHIVPGFGRRYGAIDEMPRRLAKMLLTLPGSGTAMRWADEFSIALGKHEMGWLSTGLAAAVYADLGFAPRQGAGLYQLMSAPGLLAHGIELFNKPLTSMPFPRDENYVIEGS